MRRALTLFVVLALLGTAAAQGFQVSARYNLDLGSLWGFDAWLLPEIGATQTDTVTGYARLQVLMDGPYATPYGEVKAWTTADGPQVAVCAGVRFAVGGLDVDAGYAFTPARCGQFGGP